MARLTFRSPELAEAIATQAPFDMPGFSGVATFSRGVSMGRLPEEYSVMLKQALADERVTYVIFSYSTPIAWVLDGREVVIPEVKYSMTTTRHQNVARMHLKPKES